MRKELEKIIEDSLKGTGLKPDYLFVRIYPILERKLRSLTTDFVIVGIILFLLGFILGSKF